MKKKILIIDDSQTDSAIMKGAVEQGGLEAFIATSGEEGLRLARQVRPDLILLDLMLPDISGYEVCRRLKSDPELSRTIVVIVSIKDQISEITEGIHAGAIDYVIKPSNPESLVGTIKSYLGLV